MQKKRFGQNFLHDKNIINQIVKASNSEGKNIVEVGPGPWVINKASFRRKNQRVFWQLKQINLFYQY